MKLELRRWMLCALVGVVTFLAYLPSLDNGFVDWDDNVNFLENRHYRGLGWENLAWMATSFHLGHYHPLTWVTLGLDHVLWEMDPFGYHLTNNILHALTAAAFAWVASMLLGAQWVPEQSEGRLPRAPGEKSVASRTGVGVTVAAAWFGAIVALAWSLHPLRVEAVSWITERREVLCGFLTLLTIGSHLRRGPWWITTALGLLAMLSKATAVTIPVLLVLIDVTRAGASPPGGFWRSLGRALARQAVLIAAAAAFVVTAMLAQRTVGALVAYRALSFFRRIVLTFWGAGFCVEKTFWPFDLAPLYQGNIGSGWSFHPHVWWGAGLALSLALGIVATGWLARRRTLAWLTMLAAFFVLVLPTGGFGQSGPQTSADRYTYQPGWILTFVIGLAIVSAARLIPPAGRWGRLVGAALVVALLAGLTLLSSSQQRIWFSAGTLWEREIEIVPNSPSGHFQLGRFYAGQQPPRADLAEEHLRAALAIAPEYVDARHALGCLLLTVNRPAEAMAAFSLITRNAPEHRDSWFQLAILLWNAGRADEAVGALQKYVALDEGSYGAWRTLAKAQAASGKPKDAIATYERAIVVAWSPALVGDLAWLLATHPDPAIRDGRRAVELSRKLLAGSTPDFRLVMVFAAARAEAGEFEQAIRDVSAAIPTLPPPSEAPLRHLIEDLEKQQPIRAEPRFP